MNAAAVHESNSIKPPNAVRSILPNSPNELLTRMSVGYGADAKTGMGPKPTYINLHSGHQI